jgi:hypothetical protein
MSPTYSLLRDHSLLPDVMVKVVSVIFDSAFLASIIYHINLIELYIESKLPNEQ